MNKPIYKLNESLFLVLGPLLFLMTCLIPEPQGMPPLAWLTAGLVMWMGTWWVTEAVPIPVTSLLPLLIVPLADINSMKAVSSLYTHPLVFLFLGGFIISIAMEKSQLHKRIALHTMIKSGSNARVQVLAMMLVSGFLSMWINNTATTLMMLPIALSVIHVLADNGQRDNQYAKALLLGIAYAASLGGIATLIGTAPNALMAAYLAENHDIHIGFAEWMAFALPFSITMIILGWVWLTRFAFPIKDASAGSQLTSVFQAQLRESGTMSLAEKNVLFVFLLAASMWVTRPYLADFTGLAITDTGIAIFAALLLFILPSDTCSSRRVMNWKSASEVPWGILLLFGGGLALASQIKNTGLAEFLANMVANVGTIPLILGVLLVAGLICFLTEITSNTATAAGFIPLLGPVSEAITGSPLTWVIPTAIAASCAFMMPVATPPNAIVFGSGEIKIKDMVKAGVVLNVLSILLISLVTLLGAREVLNF